MRGTSLDGRLIRALTFAGWLVVVTFAALPARAEGHFFLFVGDEPPQPALVQAAFRETIQPRPNQQRQLPLAAGASRERLGKVFPRLFAGGNSVDRTAFEGELKAARGAHFNGQFQESEAGFVRAFDSVKNEPEILADAKLFQRLVDGAATRYKNSLARKRPKTEARAQIQNFLERYPMASPTASDHAPEVVTAWNEVRAELKKGFGSLLVNVHPVELERGGGCKLYLNGAEVADLPLPGALAVPRGEHLLQVRCGPQLGWLQRIAVGAAAVSVRVPVRAMLSARGDAGSGGIVLSAPSEGDASALVDAISTACELDGAVVVVAATQRAKFGQWQPNSDQPALDLIGDVDGVTIVGVRTMAKGSHDEVDSGGRVWTWVVGGVGLATLAGAVVANVITADEINAGKDAEGLKTTTVALYIAGGALVATGIVLFFVEGGDDDGESASFGPGPGGMMVRF